MKNLESYLIRRQFIPGSRNSTNYLWGLVLSLFSGAFLVTGAFSYFQRESITFFPQGFIMFLYGFIGILVSIYLWFAVLFGVGEGFNEFNKKTGKVRIFRLGFPGKNRRIDLSYPIKDIVAIKVEIREGFNPKQILYMRMKGKRDIPIRQTSKPLTLEEIEGQAVELARFLQVGLETN